MKFLLIGLALLAAGVGVYYKFDGLVSAQTPGQPDDDAIHLVKRSDLSIRVIENGTLKAKNSVQLKPNFRGEGLITWVIEEGESVEEGDALVEFDKKDQTNRIAELDSQIVQLEVTLEAGRAGLEIERRDAEAQIEKAELTLRLANMELEKYEKGEAPNERIKLEVARRRAVAEFDRAEEKFAQVPELHAEGFFTNAELESEKLKVEEASIAMDNAGRALKLFEEYTYEMNLAVKNAAVRDAERGLRNTREKTAIRITEKDANITRQGGQLATMQSRVEKYRTDLENMTMRATQAGIVHYGDPRSSWSRERVKIGNRVYQGTTVITLPDLKEMEVLLQVHEADIDRIALEQPATVTLETYPGEIFTGHISQIAAVASSSGWDENTKTFRLTVLLDECETELRAGISCKVEIQIEHLSAVLSIPLHAAIVEDGETFCFILKDGEIERRAITIGLNNLHFVEITDGLAEGDQVLLYDPRDRQGKRAVNEQSSADAGTTTPAETVEQ